MEQLLDNIETFRQPDPLSRQEELVLEQAAKAFLQDLGVPCSACRYCCSSCSAGLDIPLLIKGYNERNVSGETWRIAELAHSKGADRCEQCGACLKHCPQKIDIPAIMKKIASHTC